MVLNKLPVTTLGLAVLLLLAAYSNPCPAQLDTVQKIHLETQSLSSAIIELGKAYDISIAFPARLVHGRTTQGIHGELSPREALEQLLSETGLELREITPSMIAVVPATSSGDASVDRDRYEEIYVLGEAMTGSYLKKTDPEGSAPVTIFSKAEIERQGSQTLGEFLKFYPSAFGSNSSTSVSNGGNGTATVTLRGLPSNSTLVLLNGKRFAYSGISADTVDLNMLPISVVERVEVLKSGASALYGSDAVAGVVNIITKEQFDGIQLKQYYGISSRDDLETTTTELLWGLSSENASVLLALSSFDQQAVYSRDRAISDSADARELGGIDRRSSATPRSRITLPDGSTVILEDGEDGTAPSDFRPVNDGDLYDFAQDTSSISPAEQDSAYLSGRYAINDELAMSADAYLTRAESSIIFAPTPIMTAFENRPIRVSSDNIYNPFGQDIHDLRHRFVELGLRTQENENTSQRLDLALEGHREGVHWETSINWNRVDSRQTATNLVNGARLQQAVGDDDACTGDCVPVNLFGPPFSMTREQAEFIRFTDITNGENEFLGLSYYLDGQLWQAPGGPVLAAVGIDVREEWAKVDVPPESANGYVIGFGSQASLNADRAVHELFSEAHIPLASHRPALYSLDLELALRHSRYSDFGESTTPKIGLRYRPTGSWLVRGNYSEGFRAPSLNELYSRKLTGFAFLTDPCSIAGNVDKLSGCRQQSDPTRLQFFIQSNGNDRLQAETAQTATVGFVWTPLDWPDFTLSLDYFNIKQRNAIDLMTPHYVVRENAAGRLDESVSRDDNGNITRIDTTYINIGNREVSGVDFSVGQHWSQTQFGNFSVSLNGSYLHEYINQSDPRAPPEDIAGTFVEVIKEGNGALPEWQANIKLGWDRRNWGADYMLHYVSSMSEELPSTGIRRKIGDWKTHHARLHYAFGQTDTLKMTLGVDNVFDESPPLVASAFNDNIDARTHNLIGRFWYLELSYALR